MADFCEMMDTFGHFGHLVWPQLLKNIAKRFTDALFLIKEKISLYFQLLLGAYTRNFQFLDFVNFQWQSKKKNFGFTWLLYPQTGSCNFAHWYIRTVPILGYYLSVVVEMSYVKYWIFSEFLKFGQIYVFAYTLTWDYMAAVLKLRKFQTAVSPKVRNIESPNGYQKKGRIVWL